MSASRGFDAIVIGAGSNGLAASVTLARAGMRVLVVDGAEAAGGSRRVMEFAPGFKAAALGFDPGWVPPAVSKGLGLTGVGTVPLEAPLTSVVEPGRCLTLWSDVGKASESIGKHSAKDAARWPAFLRRMQSFASVLETLYQSKTPDIDSGALSDLPSLIAAALKVRGLGRAEIPEFLRTLPISVWELIDDNFDSVALKATLAPGGVQDLRQGPRSNGTTFNMLHHMAGTPAGTIRGRGRFAAGPEAFTKTAEEAARRAGVTIRTGARVERVEIKDDAVRGVVLAGGEEIASSFVLSTADPARTFLKMLDPVWLDPEFLHAVRNIRLRGCAATILYALDALPEIPGLASPSALAGIVTLTPDLPALERAADAGKYGRVSEKPHVEFTVATIHAPSLAPQGKHVLVARAQYAPYRLRDGAVWDAARGAALEKSVSAAIEVTAPGFGSRVLHRRVLTPGDIEETYGLTEGAPSQGEIALDQILFMRPVAGYSRYATPISGLFYGGAGAHPGPGILGAAGYLAARRLIADRKAGSRGT